MSLRPAWAQEILSLSLLRGWGYRDSLAKPVYFIFCSARNQTQALEPAKQVLYIPVTKPSFETAV